MQSIFTRTYVAIALLIVAAFMLTVQFTNNRQPVENSWESFVSKAQIKVRETLIVLAANDENEWPEIVQQAQRNVSFDLSLRRWARLPSPFNAGAEFAVDFAVANSEQNPWWLFLHVPNSPWYLLATKKVVTPKPSFYMTLFDRYIPVISVFLVLGIGIAHLSYRISKPVVALTNVAKRFGNGDLSARAHFAAPPPINDLAQEFNRMADHLNSTIQDQRVMIGAIPHELRMPLSRMRFALDIAQNSDDSDNVRRYLKRLDRYIDELGMAVEDIIFLTKTGPDDAIIIDRFDVSDFLCDIETGYSKTQRTLSVELPEKSITVDANLALMKRALNNLISNALRYCQQQVRIHMACDLQQVSIFVDDDGTGIPFAQRTAVFAPFMRIDPSRDRRTGGVGLGLAIVDLIMRKHQGTVSIEDSELGGACFKISWPIVQAQSTCNRGKEST